MIEIQTKEDGTTGLIDSIEHAEYESLEAVRNFLDTFDTACFPIRAATTDSPRDHRLGLQDDRVTGWHCEAARAEHPRRDTEDAERVRSEVDFVYELDEVVTN